MTSRSLDATPSAVGTPEYVYDYVLNLLKRHRVHSVLDCPAGHGAFTARLLHHGYDVCAGDINNDQFELSDRVDCRYADMNDRLPYNDASFDAVVCLNGMHRVWARGRALGQFARVLADGGLLIITTVNNVNVIHRMAFLACGSANYNTIGPPHGFLPDAAIPAASYRAPLTIADVVNIGASAGLSVETLGAVNLSWRSVGMAPIAIIAWCLSLCLPRRFYDHCYVKESNGWVGMFADYTAIVLRKANEQR